MLMALDDLARIHILLSASTEYQHNQEQADQSQVLDEARAAVLTAINCITFYGGEIQSSLYKGIRE